VGVNPQRLMMSFVEDDRSTSPASAHNATLAVGGDSAWRTGALGLVDRGAGTTGGRHKHRDGRWQPDRGG